VCKRAAALDGQELVISIDLRLHFFIRNAIRELAACFSEPKMGSVGGREWE